MISTTFFILCLSLVSVGAFQIQRYSASVNGLTSLSKRRHQTTLFLGSEFERTPPKPTAVEVKVEDTTANAKEEAQPQEPKKEISDSMRNKLRKELISQGADPNYSAGPVLGNPILLISGVVAILVILGGKDVFF